jgi:hypothetical protein
MSAPSAKPADDLPPLPAVPAGRYRHYKGNLYDLIGAVRHSETLELLALYRPLDGEGVLWVRPWAMFFETVVVDGVERPRFERVDPADQVSSSS